MRTLMIASLIAAGLFTTASFADDDRDEYDDDIDNSKWLSIPQVYTQLESAGYRNIEKIEREGGSYEVKATNADGRRMKLYVHPQTGEIIDQWRRSKRDEYDRKYSKYDRRNSADCNKRRCRDDLPQSKMDKSASGK